MRWHIITGEYPPEAGGVADYTKTVAHALVDAGDTVDVWTGGSSGRECGRITVHRLLGRFAPRDLAVAARALDADARDGRLLLQWVPHAFGARGMNLPFALWIHGRSISRSNPIDVMVHEPFAPFGHTLRHAALATAQRAMTGAVLNAATRGFVGTPAWVPFCRSVSSLPLRWTAIPAGVPVAAGPAEAAAWRAGAGLTPTARLVGCFGRAGARQRAAAAGAAEILARRGGADRLLLIGIGSEAARDAILAISPATAPVVHATGPLPSGDLSAALHACTVMLQPFDDGVCARHGSVSTLLAHGAAVVTNAGRFTERVWHDGGVLLGPPDAAVLAALAVGLLDEPDRRARLSDGARRLYESTFDVRHTVAALRTVACG